MNPLDYLYLGDTTAQTLTFPTEPTAQNFTDSWYMALQGVVNNGVGYQQEQEPMSEPEPEPTEFKRLSNHQFHELLDQFEKLIAN